mgnify:CR=1 FL=1
MDYLVFFLYNNLSQSDTVMKIRTIFSIFTGPCTNYFLEMRDSGMEKRQRYQGFRKFSIRTRLIIALFLISIVPLTGISFYSFHIFSEALREKLSTSISQTLSMINLNMVSEIEKYQLSLRLHLHQSGNQGRSSEKGYDRYGKESSHQ